MIFFFSIPSTHAKRESRGTPTSRIFSGAVAIPRFAWNHRLQGAFFLGVLGALLPPLARAQPKTIDVKQSQITIHVGRSGLFSAFGHDHLVRAPIVQGTIDESATRPQVEFRVESRQLKVVDPDVKPEERAEIQRDMLGPKVLDSEKHPEIRFRSTSIERTGDSKWKVSGELTLRGQTRPVQAMVTGGNGAYRGTANFKQTAFGIKPVSVGGGTVKVKDELRTEFEVRAQ
jgi:polyisoprenoid-binding protein YceI